MANLLSFFGGAIAADILTFASLHTENSMSHIVLTSPQGANVAVLSAGAAIVVALFAFLGLRLRMETALGADSNHLFTKAEINSASIALQKQFSRFLTIINESLANSERHGDSLDFLSKRLQGASSDAELRIIVRDLVASNELYKRQSDELEKRLGETRAQVTELQERARQAERLAAIDALTGLANRRKFDDELAMLVAQSHEERMPLCLVMVDIDHFKAVNDKFGHRAGDAVLRQFAELLNSAVRSTDIVARYGGEEFAMILPRAPLGNGYDVAERIRAFVQTNVWTGFENSEQLKLTASFGVADVRDGETPANLVNRTDEKLYQAKSSGRNRTIVWASFE